MMFLMEHWTETTNYRIIASDSIHVETRCDNAYLSYYLIVKINNHNVNSTAILVRKIAIRYFPSIIRPEHRQSHIISDSDRIIMVII